jgi:hypothetical protein
MEVKPFKLSGINRPYLSQLVSLFLILLTFFMMMVSISQRNLKKEAAATGSLMQTFQGDTEAGQTEEDILRRQVVAGIARKAYGRVASYFPGGEAQFEGHKDKVAIRLPLEQFFAPQNGNLTSGREAFLADISDLLGHAVSGVTQDLAVTIRTSSFNPVMQDLATRRAGAITRGLLAVGAPVEQISAAVEPAKKDEIVLYLRVFITDKTAAMRYIESLWQTRQEATPGAAGTTTAQ